jgi:hypothetical protein
MKCSRVDWRSFAEGLHPCNLKGTGTGRADHVLFPSMLIILSLFLDLFFVF